MTDAPERIMVRADYDGTHEYIRADLHQQALDAAREEGRREGLEEAAKACDRIAGETRMGYSDERRRGAGMCSANIRALKGDQT